MRVWAVAAIAFLQVLLFFSHWFIYHTLISFWPSFLPLSLAVASDLLAVLFLLSISFLIASLLSFRYANGLIAMIYKITATWMGFLNFLFWGAPLLDYGSRCSAHFDGCSHCRTPGHRIGRLRTRFAHRCLRAHQRAADPPAAPDRKVAQSARNMEGPHRAACDRSSPGQCQRYGVFRAHCGYCRTPQPFGHSVFGRSLRWL